MKFRAEFERKIRDFCSPFEADKVIVGLSGGADSVCLLASLVSAGCDCIAAHCNFNLRGKESERDQLHSRMIAEELGVEFISIKFDVQEYISSHKCSLETACRELRYAWFQELCDTTGAKWIAVGHHKEDNNETFMLNLMRGTGIRGLRGMRPVNGNIIRPLLHFSRAEIELYLEQKGLPYIYDSSNSVDDVARNKIRNIILPALRECFPNSDNSINNTVSNLFSTEAFINEMMAEEKKIWDKDGVIDIALLDKSRESAGFILFELLNEKGFNASQSKEILESVRSGASGKLFLNKQGERFTLDRGKLVLIPDAADDIDVEYMVIPRSEFTPGIRQEIEFFDIDILEGTPLSVRKWQIGDRMKPFGMKKGSKLVSDILRDAGYSLLDKENTRLLVKGDVILWVIGLRRSAHYPVRENADKILKVSVSSKLAGSEK